MKKRKKVLAIIPARGGSKSIPKKNIYLILGKPLIFFTIEAAKRAKLIDRIIVSTDSAEIAEVAKKCGAEVPFLRPRKLSGDKTPDLPVFQHTLMWLKEKEDYTPDLVVHLWPTSPLRDPKDIDKAIKNIFSKPEADSIRSITTPSQVPFKMWTINKKGSLAPIMKSTFKEIYKKGLEPHSMPRQLLPKTFVQTGYLSVIRPKTIMGKNSMHGEIIIPFLHDPALYTEFDSLKDLFHTEYNLKKYFKS
ncbi:acylneuraminate cytidylyltransferase family protein [Candidatus Parcubacteria bacterium]|nr:MAG: acylneuraminate cytidylyltransferase family protein [Candidatus Parcubacteria bacterium]